MRKILVIFLLGIFVNTFSSGTLDLEFKRNAKNKYKKHYFALRDQETKDSIYVAKFNETVEFIKKHEGFRSKPYLCLGKKETIGYGFMTKYIDKKFRDSISRYDADLIIRQKIKRGIKAAQRRYKNLNRFQYLAISHIIYSKGEGTLISHPLNNELKKGFININTILNFGPFERSHASYAKHYRRNRKFEFNLFYLKC